MDKTWVKLFRRIKTHSLATDMVALGVFTWLLINVNPRTGKLIIGRFATSEQLGLKPTTFRNIIKRLEKKHGVLRTAVVPGRYTEISLINWAKYQAPHESEATLEATPRPQLKNNNNSLTNTLSLPVNGESTANYLLDEKITLPLQEAGSVSEDDPLYYTKTGKLSRKQSHDLLEWAREMSIKHAPKGTYDN